MIAVRTSTDASRMMPKVDRVLPSARAWRMRRTMFSTSMIASSTTTPMATTRPASTITLSVAPARSRTKIAATSDNGMAIKLMNAVRHSNSRLAMINTTRPTPISMAVVRLSMDCSMNVAGRKIVVSIAMSGRPGFISAIACSIPRVTSMVFAPRYFCTTSKRPSPSLTTASPISGPGSTTTLPRSPIRTIRPFRSATGICASCSGSLIG